MTSHGQQHKRSKEAIIKHTCFKKSPNSHVTWFPNCYYCPPNSGDSTIWDLAAVSKFTDLTIGLKICSTIFEQTSPCVTVSSCLGLHKKLLKSPVVAGQDQIDIDC